MINGLLTNLEAKQYKNASYETKATMDGIEIKETDVDKEIPTETVLAPL